MQISTDEEVVSLLRSFIYRRGADGVSEEEAIMILEWAARVRASAVLLTLAVSGKFEVDIDWGSGEIVFFTRGGDPKDEREETQIRLIG